MSSMFRRDTMIRAGLPANTSWRSVVSMIAGNTLGRICNAAAYTVGVLIVAELWGLV